MRARFRILPTVLTCIVTLVLLSAGTILTLDVLSKKAIFSEMASRAVARSLAGLELALEKELNAAVEQADYIADAVRAGEVDFVDRERFEAFVEGSFAAAPQIDALAVSNADGKVFGIARGSYGELKSKWFQIASGSPLSRLAEESRLRRKPYWGRPAYNAASEDTLMNLRVPIWRKDEYLGFVTIGISTEALSIFALELSDPPRSTVYVLYGEDKILAHMYLITASAKRTADNPLLKVDEIIDPVVGRLGEAVPWRVADVTLPEGAELLRLDAAGDDYILIQKTMNDFADQPLTIGAYSTASSVVSALKAVYRSIAISIALLVAALIISVVISRMITRPVRETSDSVATIATLDFERVAPLRHSMIKEVDDLANSFNAMLVGLRSFGRYVPQTLVKRLIRQSQVGAGTEKRQLTIMFTDIAGFSPLCEGMSPAEVAQFINRHLELVVDHIEREDGTIDKYIGDAVMAFWGAPDAVDDAPARAVRAAAAIQQALAADNAQRQAAGLPPVRMRIGIHTGPTIVGDIGAPTRINYTVVGDTVNTAQRLESLGKEIAPEAESITLISEQVKAEIGDAFHVEMAGSFRMKGKQQEVAVYRLIA